MVCECANWVRGGDGRILASHADICPKYDPVGDCLTHVHALLVAMDKWASDEDGVHGDAFDAYEEARAFVGQPLPPNPDGRDDVEYKATKPMEAVVEAERADYLARVEAADARVKELESDARAEKDRQECSEGVCSPSCYARLDSESVLSRVTAELAEATRDIGIYRDRMERAMDERDAIRANLERERGAMSQRDRLAEENRTLVARLAAAEKEIGHLQATITEGDSDRHHLLARLAALEIEADALRVVEKRERGA